MSHIRTQIRHALAAALTGLPTTGARVNVNRGLPVSVAAGPVLGIAIPGETITELGLDPLHQRALQIEVNGYAAIDAGLDDLLDQIGLEVEQAMVTAGLLGGLIKAVPALAKVEIGIDDSAATPMGRIRMTYTTQTFTAPAAPDTVI
jgi:hypothetical protein